MKKIKIHILLILIVFAANSSYTQQDQLGNWIRYYGTYQLPSKNPSKRLSLYTESQLRLFNINSKHQESLQRIGLNYRFYNEKIKLSWMGTLGGARFHTNDYDEPYNVDPIIENRVWQQFTFWHRFRNNTHYSESNSISKTLKLLHFEERSRIEQRWIKENNNTKYQNRVRHRLKITYPISRKLYFCVYDELFININKNPYDQNRLYGAIGFNIFTKFLPWDGASSPTYRGERLRCNAELGVLRQNINGDSYNRLQLSLLINTNKKNRNKKSKTDNCNEKPTLSFTDTNYNYIVLNSPNSDTTKPIQTGTTSANNTTGIQGLKGGSVKVKVLDESNEGFPFVNVAIYQNGKIKGGATTDFDGVLRIYNLHAGTWDLVLKFPGYQTYRIEGLIVKEGKLLPLSPVKLRESNDVMLKPIIYLYPEKTQEIEVQLDYDGVLTHTYPKYTGRWKVTANPDGALFDTKNQEYYALYWEGNPNKDYTINEGFVVPGEQTIDFLENTLSRLGLNRKEANEFIIYWLPKMENNPYNLIHFSTTQYEEMARLNITPTPETLIRVMMVFKPLDNPIKIKKQNLNSMSKKRKGFTVVEWGGHPLPKSYSLDL